MFQIQNRGMLRSIRGACLGLVALAAAATSFAPLSAAIVADLKVGDQIRFFDREGNIGGGEFGVAKLPAKNTELFRTFCIERSESLDFESKGFVVAGIGSTTSGGKSLDPKVAYLYSKFRDGTLAGYDFTPGSSNHVKSANALQAAMWLIQGESGYGLGGNFGVFNSLSNSVKNKALAFKTAAINAVSGPNPIWTGLGLVRVANIEWNYRKHKRKDGDPAQDVLILIPEPASIVFWLTATSMVGVGAVIRRRRTGADAS